MSIYPKLIIGGAPKCGTSTIYSWLHNSSIFNGSTPKETHYFLDAGHPLLQNRDNYSENGLSGYNQFWIKDSKKISFEASTHYLYSDTARHFFSSLQSPPLMIFVLRDPADRVYSSFQYSQHNLAAFDKRISFKSYLQYIKDDMGLPKDIVSRKSSRYVLERDLMYSNYALFIERWMRSYPKGLLKIVFFEEIMKDSSIFLNLVSDHFDIKNQISPAEFRAKNVTNSIPHHKLHRLLRRLNLSTRESWVKKVLKSTYRSILPKQTRTKEELHAIRECRSLFSDSNDKLAYLLGRELPWEK